MEDNALMRGPAYGVYPHLNPRRNGLQPRDTSGDLAALAEFGLSVAPGSGEAMSARDAWNASGEASNALLSGRYGDAASGYGNMLAAMVGAVPGIGVVARGTQRGAAWMDRNVPGAVNRLLDRMAPKDAANTLNIFAGPTARTTGAVNHELVNIDSLDHLRQQLSASSPDEKFFVRWSAGPEHDMKPGAVSRDYQSGLEHPGLSAQNIDHGMSNQELFKFLRDYSYFNTPENPVKPHIYSGKAVGIDSDGADSIRPSRYVGTMSEDMVSKFNDESYFQAMKLTDAIDMYKRILSGSRSGAPSFYEGVEKDLLDAQAKLEYMSR